MKQSLPVPTRAELAANANANAKKKKNLLVPKPNISTVRHLCSAAAAADVRDSLSVITHECKTESKDESSSQR